VTNEQDVTLSVVGLGADQDVWAVIQPLASPRYHPQRGPISRGRDGAFTAKVFFGQSSTQNIGERFRLLVVVADHNASEVFSQYLNSSNSIGSFPGLSELPSGARALAVGENVRS
jgi:hypothetical protein